MITKILTISKLKQLWLELLINKTDKVSINLHFGWDGGYVNDIETEADFYCALFSYNGA